MAVNHEMPTLREGNPEHGSGQGDGSQGWISQPQNHFRVAAGDDAGSAKATRQCKQCGCAIGKGKQLCQPCRLAKRRARRCSKGHWHARDNFKRDDRGNVIEKLCTACQSWKPSGEFRPRKDTASGLFSFCKECEAARQSAYRRRFLAQAKEARPTKLKSCAACGRKFTPKGSQRYCSDDCSRSAALQSMRAKFGTIHVITHATCRTCQQSKPLADFYKPGMHIPKIRPWACAECQSTKKNRLQKKYRKEPKNKPRHRLSKRFRETMGKVKAGGSHHLRDFIGCSTAFLRKHLESQFKRGMTWSNYGTKWHVDHILPVSSFDHSDKDQVRKCWHFSNLRPLWADANIAKSNQIITCQPELLLTH